MKLTNSSGFLLFKTNKDHNIKTPIAIVFFLRGFKSLISPQGHEFQCLIASFRIFLQFSYHSMINVTSKAEIPQIVALFSAVHQKFQTFKNQWRLWLQAVPHPVAPDAKACLMFTLLKPIAQDFLQHGVLIRPRSMKCIQILFSLPG